MKTLLRAVLLGCMLLSELTAAADDSELLAAISARLSPSEVVRGQFTHEKHLAGFKQPLISRGDFLVWRGHGVLWQTREPFASTLAITASRVRAHSDDATLQRDAAQEPGVREINALLFAVLAGDLDALRTRFSMRGELRQADAWQLLLTPTDAALAGVISQVELEGSRQVQHVLLQERSGDSSDIRFDNLSTASAPSATEAASLAD